ncbi:MAG: hypothetical protein K2Y23_16360 [Cyanobacteria bacterium]|nr:hypothetical protein [Cyanobacteriota bacterium]
MTIQVKTTYAPELLIYVIDEWPTLDEQTRQRERLIVDGHLQEHTAALVDFRNVHAFPQRSELETATMAALHRKRVPQRVAYVVQTPEQAAFVSELKTLAADSARSIEGFLAERDAIRWLFPSGGSFPLSFLD